MCVCVCVCVCGGGGGGHVRYVCVCVPARVCARVLVLCMCVSNFDLQFRRIYLCLVPFNQTSCFILPCPIYDHSGALEQSFVTIIESMLILIHVSPSRRA